MTNSNSSENKAVAWKIWQEAPWGRMFYTVAHANLQRHLDTRPLRILDVGGGNGLDAIYLAQLGHNVTLLDSSAEMLAAAHDNAISQQVVGQMIFHQVDATDLSALNLSPDFDVVLCHNLLQYVDEPAKLLKSLGETLKDNGYLSIICGNRYSESLLLALQHLDFESAYAQLDATSRNSGVFGKASTYTPLTRSSKFSTRLDAHLLGSMASVALLITFLTTT